MTAWPISSFRGRRAVFSPEWGNGAVLEDSPRIYEAMYTHLARIWIAENYATHLVSMLFNDDEGITGWHWLGFGLIAADSVRDLSPARPEGTVPAPERQPVEIRQASVEDIHTFMELEHALSQHLAGSSTFLVGNAPLTRKESLALLEDSEHVVWLAVRTAPAVRTARIDRTAPQLLPREGMRAGS